MSKDIVSQLKKLRNYEGHVNPDRAWVVREKERLMGQIGNMVEVEKSAGFSFADFSRTVSQAFSIFIPQAVMQIARPIFVFLLVGAIATSGWIASASATENCLPGEICYGVKLAMEKTQVLVASVASSDEAQTQLHLEFANRRAHEAQKVVNNKHDDSDEQATVAIKHLKDSLKSAETTVQNAGDDKPVNSVEMAKNVNEKTDQIVATLKEVSKETSVGTDLAKEVVDGAKIANETGIKAIEIAIQKQADGSSGNSKEDVKNLVENKINTILQQTESTKAATEEVRNITISTSSTQAVATTGNLTAVSSTIAENPTAVQATSTVSTNAKTAVEQFAQAVQKADAGMDTAKKVAEEAKGLMNSDKLMEAVQKVKEGNDVVNQAQQAVAQATQIAKDTMPTAVIFVPSPLADKTATSTQAISTTTPVIEKK